MKQELKALEGTWTIVALEIDGQKMEGDPYSGQVVVKGDRFTTKSMGAAYAGIVKVDGRESPKQFDLEFTEGPEKGNTNRGIYELDGDTWRICLNTTGGARPAQFATKPGSGLALETLRRGKPAAAPANRSKETADEAAAPPEGDPAPELAGGWGMQAMVFNGQPLEAQYLAYGTREATETQIKVSMGRQVILEAAYRVDRSQQPHHMNYTLARAPHKGKPQYGIYRLDGETLETCFAAPGGERPTEFGSKAGDGRTHTIWKRRGK